MVYRPNIDQRLCFVLMPFQSLFFEYFQGIFAPAAEEAGLKALKADDIYGTAPIIRDIWQSIWSAKVVIADVTGKNPNVNYELGLCHALGVPTILLTQDLADVPFDYRHLRCIVYDTRRVDWQDKLRKEISLTISVVLNGAAVDELSWPYDTNALRSASPAGPFVPAEEAQEFLSRGITQGRDAISMAFGLHGTTVSVSSAFGEDKAQRSGFAIANALVSSNPLVQLGLDQVRAVTREAAAELGDGTKTVALIFSEMVLRGFLAIKRGAVLRDLIHDMDVAVEAAVKHLRVNSWLLSEGQALGVATTAALGDSLSGRFVEEATRKAGTDGMVSVEDSANLETSIVVQEGMYFDRGFITDRFITDEPRQMAILEDACILICNFRITSMKSLLPLLEQVVRAKKSLLVIAHDVEGEALETLVENNLRKTLRSAAVKSPGLQARQELLEDIAVSTGGVVIQYATMLESANLAQLGSTMRVEISKDSTWLIGPASKDELVASRAAGIRQQISVVGNAYESEKLRERLAKLVGATSVIRVGGASSVDRDERRYRIFAALHSIRAAIAGGVIVGGGSGLWRARFALMETDGDEIVSDSLTAPLITQLKNSRVDSDRILQEMENQKLDTQIGFNARTQAIGNLTHDGILDPCEIAVRGLQIAFSHARKVLQTGAWDISQPQTNAITRPQIL